MVGDGGVPGRCTTMSACCCHNCGAGEADERLCLLVTAMICDFAGGFTMWVFEVDMMVMVCVSSP